MNANSVKHNMEFQIKYCKEVSELLDTCEDKELTGDLTADDLNQLREHCENIMRASDTAIKLATLLKEAQDKEKKEKAETKKVEPAEPAEPEDDLGFDFDD